MLDFSRWKRRKCSGSIPEVFRAFCLCCTPALIVSSASRELASFAFGLLAAEVTRPRQRAAWLIFFHVVAMSEGFPDCKPRSVRSSRRKSERRSESGPVLKVMKFFSRLGRPIHSRQKDGGATTTLPRLIRDQPFFWIHTRRIIDTTA